MFDCLQIIEHFIHLKKWFLLFLLACIVFLCQCFQLIFVVFFLILKLLSQTINIYFIVITSFLQTLQFNLHLLNHFLSLVELRLIFYYQKLWLVEFLSCIFQLVSCLFALLGELSFSPFHVHYLFPKALIFLNLSVNFCFESNIMAFSQNSLLVARLCFEFRLIISYGSRIRHILKFTLPETSWSISWSGRFETLILLWSTSSFHAWCLTATWVVC